MNYMTSRVQHEIAIVPIFDLKQKGNYAVSRHTFDEVSAGFLESTGGFVSVFSNEIFI